MRTPHLYGATYGIVQNEKNEILMLQRQNTGYFDGGRCLPAGHIEQGELSSSSIQHEILEEIGVTISPDDAKLFYVLHRINDQASGSREYMDLCYTIKNRTGDIKNTEPDKCSDLQRFAHDSLPDYMSVENRLFIEHYFSHGDEQIRFGEIDERE